jgi:DNA-binding CsgD family transcriptional regulator
MMDVVSASGCAAPLDAIVALLARAVASEGWMFAARNRSGALLVSHDDDGARALRWSMMLAEFERDRDLSRALDLLDQEVDGSVLVVPLRVGRQIAGLVRFERRASARFRGGEREEIARAVSVIAPWIATCETPHAVYMLDAARRLRAWWIAADLDEALAQRLVPHEASLAPALLLSIEAALRGAAFGLPNAPWERVTAAALSVDDTGDVLVAVGPDGRRDRIVARARTFGLSGREVDVLHRLLVGEHTPAIARTLGIGAHTVRDHLKSVMRKTAAPNRVALAARILGYDELDETSA